MLTDGEETTSTETVSTEPQIEQPDLSANAKLIEIYESGIADARARAERAERDLAALRQQQQAPPAEPKMDNNEFWANAAENVSRIVETALDKRIKPLTDYVAETRGANEYDRIKDKLRNNPNFRDKFADVEPYLDEVMKTTAVSDANVNAAALSIVGALAIGQLKPMVKNTGGRNAGDPPPVPPNPSTTKNDSAMMPAHLRPSGPSVTQQQQQKKERRPLTELEKRIARETRMTDDEYLDELEVEGPMQIHDLIPKSKEEKKK